MSTINPFKISVQDQQILQLRQRLELASWPDELDGAEWDYGAPLADIRRLASYWKDGFDWRQQEEKLNGLPQFRTSIEVESFGSLDIHFVHQQSPVKSAIPLIFIHGWPGGFFECSKMLPLLTMGDADSPAFHVVAPSLPNFGFSEGVKKRGFGLAQHAEVCHKLMQKLGYQEYVTQGGDWGAGVSTVIRHLYPGACRANHLNTVYSSPPSFSKSPIVALQHALTPYTEEEKQGLARTQAFQNEGFGYFHEQSTKPQTLGYALADSPVALLAWIYEKLHDWTDAYPFTDDEILTWISLYWFSRAGPAASIRLYYEFRHDREWGYAGVGALGYAPRVVLGFSYMGHELSKNPRIWNRTQGPIVFESDHPDGGHFAVFEKPELIAADLRAMFGRKGGAFGLIKGKDGHGLT
ncbi:MAG: hypothetical protein M4579_000118 [Chaenotheca gracillima]|nr:MAG: hypothetical protein M4579_000118 [Chaenotheca gracillima]